MRLAPLLPLILAAAAAADCGGVVTQNDAGSQSLEDGQTPKPEQCTHGAVTMTGTCGDKQVKITSSAAACGVMTSGQQTSETCVRVCGFAPCYADSIDLRNVQCGDSMGCIGRRPEGLAPFDAPENVPDYFATMAALEAASVDAFVVMERELEAHGAPKRLVRRARRAARDEKRHAKIVAALATRFGAEPKAPVVSPIGSRSLEAAALENAVEGCVRETWGAVAGAWQARASEDARVRAVMDDLSRDEIRHAELSWAVHAWAMKRLDPEGRQRIRDAMRRAADDLREAACDPKADLVRTVGLPRGREALALLSALDERVWRLEIARGTA